MATVTDELADLLSNEQEYVKGETRTAQMMHKSKQPDQCVLDLEQLWALLPRRIPGRVKEIWRDESGKISVLIPLAYPDGQPMSDVYCPDLNNTTEGQEVIFEWRESSDRERRKQEQPHLIQAAHLIIPEPGEVGDLIQEYKGLLGQNIQEQLGAQLRALEQERRHIVQTVDERVTAELQTRVSELEARQFELDERDQDLEIKALELRSQESKLKETVSTMVEELLAARRLELDQREARLGELAGRIAAGTRTLEQERQKLRAEWKVLVEQRNRFEMEGGQAYLEYLKTIGAADPEDDSPAALEAAREPFDASRLVEKLEERGYHIEPELLEQAVISTIAAWSAGQFVVLAGPTGVGKTQLVRQLASILGAGHGIVSVRPGWVEPADLIGFYNPSLQLFEPTPALDRLLRARQYADADRFYLLCLDEMNLSRVENYAADLLSQLELTSAGVPAQIDLYSRDIARRFRDEEAALRALGHNVAPELEARRRTLTGHLHRYPPRLELPSSLVLLGTVNVDETTQMFSPKFLDRAYVLRFPPISLPERLEQPLLQNPHQSPLWPLTVKKAMQITRTERLPAESGRIWKEFVSWQSEYFSAFGIYFGHRFYANFRRYLAIGVNLGVSDPQRLAEEYFHAKILPRIRFNPDERGIGRSETKMDILQAWVDHDTLLKAYSRLRKCLVEMIQRSEGRGMVEYWD